MRPRSSVHPPDRGASDPGSPQPVHNSLLEARPYDDAEGIEYCLPVRDGALAIPRQSKPNATKTPAYFTRRKPPTELISAFEMLTLESASLPHINSTRNPSAPLFLTRNARSGFESLMRRKRRVSSSLSEEGLNRPEPVIRLVSRHSPTNIPNIIFSQFPSEDTLRINLILVGTPFSRAPDSVVASFQLEFVRIYEWRMLLSLIIRSFLEIQGYRSSGVPIKTRTWPEACQTYTFSPRFWQSNASKPCMVIFNLPIRDFGTYLLSIRRSCYAYPRRSTHHYFVSLPK